MCGGSLSTTVTVKEQELVCPVLSVAVEMTVVVPFGKGEPDGGTETTVGVPQSSVAVTEKVTTAEQRPGSAF